MIRDLRAAVLTGLLLGTVVVAARAWLDLVDVIARVVVGRAR